jgi:hypothetical protein
MWSQRSVSSCILTFIYRLWVPALIFYVLVLSWALMCAELLSLGPSCLLLLLYGLSVQLGRLLSLLIARVVYRRWCVSSYFIGWQGNIWFYSWMWCLSLNPWVKLHALHGSVVSSTPCMEVWYPHEWQSCEGFVIHNAEVMVSRPNLGCCLPLCGFLAMI